MVARGQARVLGQCWAERRWRADAALQELPSWPAADGDEIAAREEVGQLTRDLRMLDDLGIACLQGAADWWERWWKRQQTPLQR